MFVNLNELFWRLTFRMCIGMECRIEVDLISSLMMRLWMQGGGPVYDCILTALPGLARLIPACGRERRGHRQWLERAFAVALMRGWYFSGSANDLFTPVSTANQIIESIRIAVDVCHDTFHDMNSTFCAIFLAISRCSPKTC